MKKVTLLEADAITRMLKRMTHEILERFKGTENVVIVGIKTRGVDIATEIVNNIKQFEGVSVPLGTLDITLYRDDRHFSDGNDPIVNGTEIPFDVTNKHVVLVDDVLFTGRTIRAAMDAVMDIGRPKTITVAVLIDRGHRELPIRADYVGKNIPTALHEMVSVQVPTIDQNSGVYLHQH